MELGRGGARLGPSAQEWSPGPNTCSLTASVYSGGLWPLAFSGRIRCKALGFVNDDVVMGLVKGAGWQRTLQSGVGTQWWGVMILSVKAFYLVVRIHYQAGEVSRNPSDKEK